ncbi:ribonuclease H1 small subunit [Lecanosticta acicola]|uniref:Ribonuclease H1 small subunit n=1 Tax=Lecanosticta acicola TaxID=111012 RepID=A0AAI8YU55_9PEZI|nr:ribonuclease H1 small subunit [Lecanosticta acicola]
MLSLPTPTTSSKPLKVKPNLLPCTIHHSGPIKISKRHWNPSSSQQTSSSSSYLRGRALLGQEIHLPKGYTGAILRKTGEVDKLQQNEQEEEEEEEEEAEETVEVKKLEQVGRFEEIVVWGHETAPGGEDVYIKGIREWIGFAEAMNTHDEQPREDTTT